MQPSPIQLKNILFRGILVWPRQPEPTENNKSYEAINFDFDGVDITEFVRLVPPGPDNSDLYELILRLSIRNEDGKKSPYIVDIEVYGSFEVSGIEKESHHDIVLINGCAILYSAIREQVSSITSRSIYGTLILPTVNFLDKKSNKEQVTEPKNEEESTKSQKKKIKKT